MIKKILTHGNSMSINKPILEMLKRDMETFPEITTLQGVTNTMKRSFELLLRK